jgi:alpha-glucosidase (family GH31 glycosyl hydrolase)
MNYYQRPLKVSTPDGERVIANITSGALVTITVPRLDVVAKDNPLFAKDGVIRLTVKREKYQETIRVLTQYLEDLFLKGMADEDTYTSLGAKPERKRTTRKDTSREERTIEGERDTASVHVSTRRNESTESVGSRDTSTEVDKSSNSEDSTED